MKCAHFRVYGLFDHASRPTAATVTINRAAETFSVRPLRRRTVFTVPLAAVASSVVRKLIAADVAEKKRARKAARKAGR